MSETTTVRVAVIGGGCAGITTAFELTRPEHCGRYQVTVYQQGWRLGGKGASGRGANGRIEEHGLHVWMGFYENAFRLLRECYEELGRDPRDCPIATWRDAFFPNTRIAIAEERDDGGWQDWSGLFPPMPGLPGDPFTATDPLSVSSYLVHALRLVRTIFDSVQRDGDGGDDGAWSGLASPEAVLARWTRLARYGSLTTLVGALEALRGLTALCELWARVPPRRGAEAPLVRPLETVAELLADLVARDTEGEMRRLWIVADLLLTIVRGVLRFGLVTDPRGFDAVDGYDFREWLELNGASRATLDSAFLRGVAYDLMFAYEDGDPARPRVSAGQSLRGTLRMFFTYRGAFFWKMAAGMGDVVFAPFYEVLKRRGVRFELFHRLENVRLADPARLAPGEGPHVEALEFDVQAEVQGGGEYPPLIAVDGLPCWPAAPKWEELVDGERLRREGWDFESFWDRRKAGSRTLRVGADFDFAVLAVGLGGIPHVCREILARDGRWRRMVRRMKTIETVAFQVWLDADLDELGWSGPRGVTLTGFVKPFDTWADMSHLLPQESWPTARAPRSVAYFCSALHSAPQAPDRGEESYPAIRHEAARREAVQFLNRSAPHLWPKAARPAGGFRWELLVDAGEAATAPSAAATPARFRSQLWRANVNPSDRYTLSLPGTAKDRISPLDNTYDNLTVAGDWTACSLIVGCVEAAVLSGRLAAHALSGWPRLEDIAGFDHPGGKDRRRRDGEQANSSQRPAAHPRDPPYRQGLPAAGPVAGRRGIRGGRRAAAGGRGVHRGRGRTRGPRRLPRHRGADPPWPPDRAGDRRPV